MSAARRRKSGGRSRRARKSAPTRDFWGKEQPSGDRVAIRRTADPDAMIHSLGPPPLSRPEDTARALFTLVYDKAATRAEAVARANGLVDPDGDGL